MSFQNCKISTIGMDSVAYHARKQAFKRGSPEYPMSPSALKLFAPCPHKWIRGYTPKDSKPKRWGNLFDCSVLTPELFATRYVRHPEEYQNSKGVMMPWTKQSKTCRKWEEEQKEKGFEVADDKSMDEVVEAKQSFLEDDYISSFLNLSRKQVLVTGEWLHKETGIVVPVECLIDLAPENPSDSDSSLGDIKSSFSGETITWGRIVAANGYHIQAAFDLDLFNAATGEERNTWTFLIVENTSPFEPSHKILSQDDLEIGRARVRKILGNYATCMANGRWPGYDEMGETAQGWGVVRMPKWEANREEPRFELDEEEAEMMPEEVSHPN